MTASALKRLRMLLVLPALTLCMPAVVGQRVTGQSASEALSAGDFSKAYEHYTSLLASFPRDPMYLYGAGVSLARSEIKPDEATELLQRAISLKSSIRTIPVDALFWLGRAQHLGGRYEEAADSYRQFISEAGRRESREKGVPDLIRQCEERTGAIAAVNKTEEVAQEAVITNVVPAKVEVPAINKPESIKSSSDILLSEALVLRQRHDSLSREISALESVMRSSSGTARSDLQARIKVLKDEAGKWESASDSLMIAAGVPLPESDTLKKEATTSDGVQAAGRSGDTLTRVATARPPLTVSDTITQQARTADSVLTQVARADTIPAGGKQLPTTTVPAAAGVSQLKEQIASLFELQDKPYYSASLPVQISASFPKGLYHTIQLAVLRNPVDPANLKRLYPVFGIKAGGSELTYYYAGLFRKRGDADKVLNIVRNEGFRDAFVVSFMDGRQVSAERALILEKEWGTVAFPEWEGVVPAIVRDTQPADTVPPTLLFRVEILRTEKPAADRQVEDIRKIAADRGLEIMNPSAGVYVYIVGKFLTFDSASAYADLLKRNGYAGARVAAYLGTREIPVDTAMKLFDRKEQ